MSLLAFRDVHAMYGQARILNGVTFEVGAGERVALVGRNGVGKTTVVNTLCGVTRIAQGQIELRGRAVLGPARLHGRAERHRDRAARPRHPAEPDGRGEFAARAGDAPRRALVARARLRAVPDPAGAARAIPAWR